MIVYKDSKVQTTSAIPSHKLDSEEALELSGARAVAVALPGSLLKMAPPRFYSEGFPEP